MSPQASARFVTQLRGQTRGSGRRCRAERVNTKWVTQGQMLARHYANIQMSPAHHAAIPLLVVKVAFIPSTNSSFFVLDEVEIKHSTFSFKVTYTPFHRDKITLGTCSRVGDRCTQVLITVLGGHIPLLILFTGGALAPDDHQSNQCTLSTSCCISEVLPQPHPAQDNTPNYHLL